MIEEKVAESLVAAAQAARERAYAPYSNFQVGAALIDEQGTLHTGCNVENASYGLSNCAERTAVFSMIAAGGLRVQAIAVATENGVSPCGACRQVLAEFAGDIPVLLVTAGGKVTRLRLHALLPHHFGPHELPPRA